MDVVIKVIQMKTKLILSAVNKEIEIWKNMPFIPQILDWF